MRNVLLVDISINGHRLKYLKSFVGISENVYYLLPACDEITFPIFELKSGFEKERTIKTYISFIDEIKEIVSVYNVDAVLFLCGDALYRFFGVGLRKINCEVFVVFHHVAFSKIKKISLHRIFKSISCGVVHTNSLKQKLNQLGIYNVKHIEYPNFSIATTKSSEECKKYFGIDTLKTCFILVGGTQYYKGVDLALQAMEHVQGDYQLLICGVERDLKLSEIQKLIKRYKDKVVLCLRELTDTEYQMSLNAGDYLLLPYRFIFDGASGPLVDSTLYRKPILASEHGSLGELVKNNHLGITFKTEDVLDMASVISKSLVSSFPWDEVAEQYRNSLSLDVFINEYKNMLKRKE